MIGTLRRELFDRLLIVNEHHLHRVMAECLAATIGRAGDPVSARDQLAALVPVVERVLGPEHPHTRNTRADLARWIGEAGSSPGPAVD
jgi:hypothetical protein